MGRSDAEVSLVLAGDAEMRRINRAWRGKDSTTDVLSFPAFAVAKAGKPAVAPGLFGAKDGRKVRKAPLGDVVISLPTAEAQARELGVPLGEELSRLLAHGLLHLLGYDHERSRREEARMRRMEDRLLEVMD